jgi:GxxExxY protein
MRSTREELNGLSERIIGAAIAVHRELGPGLLESAYEACLEFELLDQGVQVQRQVELPVVYRNVHVDAGFRIDMFVEQKVIVEVKSVEKLIPINDAQLLSYLKLTGCHLGLLINFNVRILKDGIKRIVREFPE